MAGIGVNTKGRVIYIYIFVANDRHANLILILCGKSGIIKFEFKPTYLGFIVLILIYIPTIQRGKCKVWFLNLSESEKYCRVVCTTRNFSYLQNPRFIIMSDFKSRADYNGARTVLILVQPY